MKLDLKPMAAILAALTITAPVAVALADEPAPAPPAQGHLLAPLGGHRNLAGAFRALTHRRLVQEHARLSRRAHRRVSAAECDRVHGWSLAHLRGANRALRREIARERAISPALRARLAAIAACESGGDPRAIGGGGAYRGKYQFDYGTWAAVGGHGDPAAAPEAEQDRRAALLLQRSGSSPWPVCG